MSFADYSNTPGNNTSLNGINVAEGCPPANLNNAIRQLAADGKGLSDTVAAQAGSMPVTGGAFTGEITRQGRGAYLNHAGSGQTDGVVYFLPEGSSLPTAAEGRIVFFYS